MRAKGYSTHQKSIIALKLNNCSFKRIVYDLHIVKKNTLVSKVKIKLILWENHEVAVSIKGSKPDFLSSFTIHNIEFRWKFCCVKQQIPKVSGENYIDIIYKYLIYKIHNKWMRIDKSWFCLFTFVCKIKVLHLIFNKIIPLNFV